ncbi:MAG: hypothetical protein NPINA01_00650 [Nitrospinaceae bacterium]|nr:MAG: hypothetical protein NPINA01_00650 [Nitrospinaceae bacterium]
MTTLPQGKIIASGQVFLFAVLFSGSLALANSLNRFELKDGSVIQGSILSYSQGVYQINSDVLGTISLPESKIRAIHPAGDSNAGASSQDETQSTQSSQQIDRLQQEMLSDPETVQLIQQLQNDPSVQEILQDRELMEAIQQGNLNRVGTDPKIQELMKNQSVGKIIEKNQ